MCCIIIIFLVATPTILKRLGCLPEVQRRIIHASAHAESMSPEERLIMIDACLISKKVCNNNEHRKTSEDSLSETAQTVKHSEPSESENSDAGDDGGYPGIIEDDGEIRNEPSPLHDQNGTDEDDVCNICLEPFAAGDEVATSDVSKCSHGFHRQCITGWLMKHDECPMCRATFIEKKVQEEV